MRFGHLELGVRDPVASRDYWVRCLGFRAVADQGPRYQWIERGGLEILLREGTPSAGMSVVFYVEDPDAEAERLRAAGAEIGKVANCWIVRDPDGHLVQVVNPHDDHSG